MPALGMQESEEVAAVACSLFRELRDLDLPIHTVMIGVDSEEDVQGWQVTVAQPDEAGPVIFQLPDELEQDVWWDFNLAYGKIHLRDVDERYKNEAIERAIILPGNPLYVFKTFRETVQETFTFSNAHQIFTGLNHFGASQFGHHGVWARRDLGGANHSYGAAERGTGRDGRLYRFYCLDAIATWDAADESL